MKYTDNNGITFNNVKDLAKTAGINDSSARYAGSEYEYDANDNPVSPKFLINAIDIDWNGAQWPSTTPSTPTTINTSGDLINAIKYASTVGSGNNGAVTSVNGHSGEVVLTAGDIGASETGHTHNYNDLTNKPTIPAAITVDTALSSSSTNPVQNKVINTALSGKAASNHTHDYNDLTNKPTIPAAITVDTALSSSSTNPVQNKVINTALSGKAASNHTHDGYVPTTRTINNNPLTGDITLSASDIGAAPSSHTHSNYVLTNRTINGKSLTSNIALSASDVGAASYSHTHDYNDLTNKPTIPAAITVDTALSSSSTNPVQNKVINNAIGELEESVNNTNLAISNLSTNDITVSQTSDANTLSGALDLLDTRISALEDQVQDLTNLVANIYANLNTAIPYSPNN